MANSILNERSQFFGITFAFFAAGDLKFDGAPRRFSVDWHLAVENWSAASKGIGLAAEQPAGWVERASGKKGAPYFGEMFRQLAETTKVAM